MKKSPSSKKRSYPAAYERAIPWIIGIMVLAVIILVIIIVSVPLGLFPSG